MVTRNVNMQFQNRRKQQTLIYTLFVRTDLEQRESGGFLSKKYIFVLNEKRESSVNKIKRELKCKDEV